MQLGSNKIKNTVDNLELPLIWADFLIASKEVAIETPCIPLYCPEANFNKFPNHPLKVDQR